MNLTARIAQELKFQEFQVHNAVKLLFEEQCTIPFVARYRKEATGALDEVGLRDIRDRYQYLEELESNRVKYMKVAEEHCQKKPELMAQWPALRTKFEKANTKQELEDLYLPFKPKRRTRAQIAKEKGLEPLLTQILEQRAQLNDLTALASQFITAADATIDPALRVPDANAALQGAADIWAEQIAETAEFRGLVRDLSQQSGMLVSKKIDGGSEETAEAKPATADTKEKKGSKKGEAHKYENYFDYKESINSAPSHRVMAVRRGEAEKILKVGIDVDNENIVKALKEKVLQDPKTTDAVRRWQENVIDESYKRLIAPSIETELRLNLKTTAESEAIKVFSKNLENLLLLPPIPGKTVMGVDPGIRTGSKLAIVNETGTLLANTTIYPDISNLDSPKSVRSREELGALVKTFNVQCIAIGNGTGSREIDRLVAQTLREQELKEVKRLTVNEAGASVYSTDDIAREEFPDLDATIRSAISIARRLQDPLAEMVKIDPRSIGVGQYQHDVNVTKLKNSLEEVVESCVNRVGVNLNTASYKLLGYVSGIGPTLAKNIVSTREKNGKFASRESLMQVSGFGPKVFEQAAGFLRIPDADNPLENSAVHPERYSIVKQIAQDLGKDLREIIGNKTLVEAVPLERYVTETVGMPTLRDIASELIKPGRDPREDGIRLMYSDEVAELQDLKPGMILPGTVTNVTNFGAFVDIGVHQDGLVHISELSTKFVEDPGSVVAVGDVLKVRVIDVDIKRKRISLSCRLEGGDSRQPQTQQGQEKSASSARPTPRQGAGIQPNNNRGGGPAPRGKKDDKTFTVNDLLAKFNNNR